MIELCPLDGPPTLVRTDPTHGFRSFTADDTLRKQNIQLQIGGGQNHNKNSAANKSIQEFEDDLIKQMTWRPWEALSPWYS